MSSNCKIHLVHMDTLSCEPFVRRAANGELVCVCQCKGTYEPAPENRVLVFHSSDNGVTWSKPESIMPENGRAVYCTELTSYNNVLRAYITTHLGHFLDWRCTVLESRDSGYTWENVGPIPQCPTYTFVRSLLIRNDGALMHPYHSYPISRDENERVLSEMGALAAFWQFVPDYVESGVLISTDNGKTFEKHEACRFDLNGNWIWSEPTIAQLSDGRIVMLLRREGTGCLWRTESRDGGKTWSEVAPTDIPNPGNKPRLIPVPDGRIVLLHTPNAKERFPYEAWISDDDMETWKEKRLITDFPGYYSYSDGFYEDGHLFFTVERNRKDIIFFDMPL